MRRLTPSLLAIGLAATLAACGSGGSDDAADGESPSVETSQEDAATEDATDEPDDPTEDAADGAASESELIAVPDGGPSGITEFPIPAGTEITDIGASSGNWQFVVTTSDPASVVDFYAAVLPDLGYTVTEDVNGVNVDLEFDLGFSGPTFGVVRESPMLGGVEVQLDEQELAQ